ncbi:MAG: ABC transporter permease, partial [Candidatus Aenigmarchaeota archaeon]|nr:ABC transporter permease [Candidatus Aenigmarchaeota archaeon]
VLLVKALLFISLVNTFAGIIIGLLSDSEGVAVLISLIITLPLLFLSGMFYPVDLMPFLVRMISDVMLLNTEILMMKQALLFGGVIAMEYFIIPFALFLASVYLVGKNR